MVQPERGIREAASSMVTVTAGAGYSRARLLSRQRLLTPPRRCKTAAQTRSLLRLGASAD